MATTGGDTPPLPALNTRSMDCHSGDLQSERMGGDTNDELMWKIFQSLADAGVAAAGDPVACTAIVGALISTRASLFFAKAANQIDDDPSFRRPKSLVGQNGLLDGGHLLS